MKQKNKTGERGFSLLEILVVVGLISVICGMAVMSLSAPLRSAQANSGLASMVAGLRGVRQQAIARRRNQLLTFFPPNQWLIQEESQPGDPLLPPAPPAGQRPTLAGYARFNLPGSLPDTPMGFGACADICINNQNGGPPVMKFTTTGGFTDGAGNPINGTVFIGQPGKLSTARAITILGSTGRVRSYSWDGAVWREQ